MTLTPQSRDYTSAKAVTAAFNAGRDFIINDPRNRWHGKPVNKPQLPPGQYTLRYDRLRKSTEVLVKAGPESGDEK